MTELQTTKTVATLSESLKAYIRSGKVADFSSYSTVKKLAIVQKTPHDKVLSRNVGGKKIPYLEFVYCRKVLNFIFNFRISTKLVSTRYHYYKEGEKNVVEAEVDVQYMFTFDDGSKELRTVTSSHKQYPNNALGRTDAKKAAISKSWTQVARTFGIGDDVLSSEQVELDIEYINDSSENINEVLRMVNTFSDPKNQQLNAYLHQVMPRLNSEEQGRVHEALEAKNTISYNPVEECHTQAKIEDM